MAAIDPEDLAALPALLEAVDGQDWPDPDAESKLRALAPSLARALLAAEAQKERTASALDQCRGLLRQHVEAVQDLKERLVAAAERLDRSAGWVEHCGNPVHAGVVREWAAEARGALAAYDAARTGREEG